MSRWRAFWPNNTHTKKKARAGLFHAGFFIVDTIHKIINLYAEWQSEKNSNIDFSNIRTVLYSWYFRDFATVTDFYKVSYYPHPKRLFTDYPSISLH